MKKTDLSLFNNSEYKPGAGFIKRTMWYYFNAIFFTSRWLPVSGFKVFLLRLFGAKVGKGVVIKPAVNIKYPWRLIVGNYVWIGEQVWIDNLDDVKIGDNVCISQGAMLLCGNHNYKKTSFDLITGKIDLNEGCWLGAYSVVAPGVTCGSHSILTLKSVAIQDLNEYTIYRGNPAVVLRKREIQA